MARERTLSEHSPVAILAAAELVSKCTESARAQTRLVESYLRVGQIRNAERAFSDLDTRITALWDAREKLRALIQEALV